MFKITEFIVPGIPEDTPDYRDLWITSAKQAFGEDSFISSAVPIKVRIVIVYPFPENKMLGEWPTENTYFDDIFIALFKALFKALNGIIWNDSMQICVLEVGKIYGDTPCVKLNVEMLNPSRSQDDIMGEQLRNIKTREKHKGVEVNYVLGKK